MKQFYKSLGTLFVFIIVSTFWTSASAVEIDGIYYFLNESDNTATVTNKGQNNVGQPYNHADYSGAIIIPSTITYEGKIYTITNIQDYAFSYCPDLITVSIPSTVSKIADGFDGCSSFKAFIVNSDNQNYSATGGVLYDKKQTILISCPQAKNGEYTVPSTVNKIRDYAFRGCTNLTSVILPNSITSIGSCAFADFSSLKSINIPTSLTELGNNAFQNDYLLSSDIVIPSGVKYVPTGAFINCSSITSITISEGVEEIGGYAFKGCSQLWNILLPSTIKKIGRECFRECESLGQINIPDGITEIPNYAFYKCSLSSITLPESINRIEEYAFFNNKITTIKIPKSVVFIGKNALWFYTWTSCAIYVYNTPSNIVLNDSEIFNSLTTIRIHVYPPLVEAFKNDKDWRKYANYIVGDIPVDPVKEITLDHTGLVMNSYTNGKITATIKPDDASVKDVVFTSSNEDVVSIIDNTGKFMTLETGTATITATAIDGSGVKATCKIVVSDNIIKAESVTLNTTKATINIGETKTIKATVLPTNATLNYVTWKSSNPDVATVDGNGVVTGVGAGTATITATAADGKGAYAECKVNVIYNTITLTDASSSYSNATEATASTIKYTRTFNSTNWQALYVPFSMKYSDWSNDFEVAAINNVHQYDDDDNGIFDRTELEIAKVKSGSLKANTPYLIKPKTTGTKTFTVNNTTLKKTEVNSIYCASVNTMYTFTGTYNTISGATMISNGYYGMGGGELVQAEDNDASLGAFRWYLKIENKEEGSYAPGKITVLCLDDEVATGIDENVIDVENKVVGIYDANGRKINEMRNGLNIVKYSDGSTKKIMK